MKMPRAAVKKRKIHQLKKVIFVCIHNSGRSQMAEVSVDKKAKVEKLIDEMAGEG